MSTRDPHSALTDKATQMPTCPGVYLMRDVRGVVIYVGKAKSLRTRVRSYFQKSRDTTAKTRLMVSRVVDIDTIVTPSEKDALILENSLIKKYRPRYNVVFRDDKEYPYLRLSVQDPFPNLTVVRRSRRDGAVYYGPFASARAVRDTVQVIQRLFHLRRCRGPLTPRSRPCLYYDMGQCPGPCSRPVSAEAYAESVRAVRLFLQGRGTDVLEQLRARMQAAADEMNFELAARCRDRIAGIEETLAKQTVVTPDSVDRDVFASCSRGTDMNVAALFVRNGRIIGSRHFFLRGVRIAEPEALGSTLSQYYQRGEFVPREVIVPCALDQQHALEELLRERRGGPVSIICPRRGVRRDLRDMAEENARTGFERRQADTRAAEAACEELRKRLHLFTLPERIACVDISNIMGTAAVGSIVQFSGGVPDRSAYRRYSIKTVSGANDYGMMEEVLTRHLERGKREGTLPDLLVVDGGKGQLAVLCGVLQRLSLGETGAVALAKGPERLRAKKKQEERIYIPGRKNPVPFPHNSPALFLLQRVRDEAHRFAVRYHRTVKKQQDFGSPLEALPGVGPATLAALRKHFGSLEGARQATREELLQTPGLSRKRAQTLYDYFHPPRPT